MTQSMTMSQPSPPAPREGAPIIAIAATFTAEMVRDSLQYWIDAWSLTAEVKFSPYNQVLQQLHDPASLLGANRSGLNVLLLRLEDLRRYQEGEKNSAAVGLEQEKEIAENFSQLLRILKTRAGGHGVPYFVCLCPGSPLLRPDFSAQMRDLMHAELADLSRVHLPAEDGCTAIQPVADPYDALSDELGHIPYTPLYFAALGTCICRLHHALSQAPYKVIVLDCDNTLWSGVCGEDGPEGVGLDAPRQKLQEFMRAQHDGGKLLCICSKNSEEDVARVFERRTDMPLQRRHFAGWQVNWQPKSENLLSLAAELQLGLDSFIFVDDNPVECAEVSANCPEVLVLPLPGDVSRIPAWLGQVWAFDHPRITEEDRQRTAMYLQNRQREQFQSTTGSLSDFIAALDLRIEIDHVSPAQLPRVAQLTSRTNQFNFTTRRRSDADLVGLLRQDSFHILAVTVSDRFGEYGLVGVVIYETTSDALTIDTFLLSCRVLGKGVEHRILSRLGEIALSGNRSFVNAPFLPTAKNMPAHNFLDAVGAQVRKQAGDCIVYCFPADLAADLRFDARSASLQPTGPQDSEGPAGREPGARPAAGRTNSPDPGQLALLSSDIDAVLKAVESSGGWRSATGTQFVAPETATQRQLATIWRRLLRVKSIGLHDNYFELGGDSLLAVRLFSQVYKMSGKQLPLATLFEAPTIEKLARILEMDGWQPSSRSLVPIKASGSKPPFYCVHGVGGNILEYYDLAKYMDDDQPFFGIQALGLNGKQPNVTVEEMAAHYIEEVTAFQPCGPYYLGGSSFGGLVAYEMARQLTAQGEGVAFLALFDTNGPGYRRMLPTTTAWERRVNRLAQRVSLHWGNFLVTEPNQRLNYLREKVKRLVNQTIQANYERGKKTYQAMRFQFARLFWTKAIREVNRAGHWAAGDYLAKEYAGRVTLFRATEQPRGIVPDPTLGWGPLVKGGMEIHDTPGHHGAIVREPRSRVLAAQLKQSLQRAQSIEIAGRSQKVGLRPGARGEFQSSTVAAGDTACGRWTKVMEG